MRCKDSLQTNVLISKLLKSERRTVLLTLQRRFVETSKTRTSIQSVVWCDKVEEGRRKVNAGKCKQREYMDLENEMKC
jgi:hypothetical protein